MENIVREPSALQLEFNTEKVVAIVERARAIVKQAVVRHNKQPEPMRVEEVDEEAIDLYERLVVAIGTTSYTRSIEWDLKDCVRKFAVLYVYVRHLTDPPASLLAQDALIEAAETDFSARRHDICYAAACYLTWNVDKGLRSKKWLSDVPTQVYSNRAIEHLHGYLRHCITLEHMDNFEKGGMVTRHPPAGVECPFSLKTFRRLIEMDRLEDRANTINDHILLQMLQATKAFNFYAVYQGTTSLVCLNELWSSNPKLAEVCEYMGQTSIEPECEVACAMLSYFAGLLYAHTGGSAYIGIRTRQEVVTAQHGDVVLLDRDFMAVFLNGTYHVHGRMPDLLDHLFRVRAEDESEPEQTRTAFFELRAFLRGKEHFEGHIMSLLVVPMLWAKNLTDQERTGAANPGARALGGTGAPRQ